MIERTIIIYTYEAIVKFKVQISQVSFSTSFCLDHES